MAKNDVIWVEGEKELYVNMQRSMEGSLKAAREGLQNAGLKIVADATRNIRKNKSWTSGGLGNSGKVQKVEGDEDAVDAGFFSDEGEGYAAYVEYGRRAGKMPNPELLIEWVRKKNLKNKALTSAVNIFNAKRRKRKDAYTPTDLLRSAAWALAKHIAKKGTRPHPFFAPAVEKNKKAVERAIANAVKEVIK